MEKQWSMDHKVLSNTKENKPPVNSQEVPKVDNGRDGTTENKKPKKRQMSKSDSLLSTTIKPKSNNIPTRRSPRLLRQSSVGVHELAPAAKRMKISPNSKTQGTTPLRCRMRGQKSLPIIVNKSISSTVDFTPKSPTHSDDENIPFYLTFHPTIIFPSESFYTKVIDNSHIPWPEPKGDEPEIIVS